MDRTPPAPITSCPTFSLSPHRAPRRRYFTWFNAIARKRLTCTSDGVRSAPVFWRPQVRRSSCSIAVSYFHAGAMRLIAPGGSVGHMLGPVVVTLVARNGWNSSQALP